MKRTLYVLSPLGPAVLAFAAALWWGVDLVSSPDIGMAVGVGFLFGLALVGVVQALYHDMLADQDEFIELMWARILRGPSIVITETKGE